jgi:hypothetical protein
MKAYATAQTHGLFVHKNCSRPFLLDLARLFSFAVPFYETLPPRQSHDSSIYFKRNRAKKNAIKERVDRELRVPNWRTVLWLIINI